RSRRPASRASASAPVRRPIRWRPWTWAIEARMSWRMSWRSRTTSSPAQNCWAAASSAAWPLSHSGRVIRDSLALGQAEGEVEVLEGLAGGALEEVVEGDDEDGVVAVDLEAADGEVVAAGGLADLGDLSGDADER